MNFLNQLLRGISFIPALVSGIEGLFAGKSGSEKKDAAMTFFRKCATNGRCRSVAGNCRSGKIQGGHFENC